MGHVMTPAFQLLKSVCRTAKHKEYKRRGVGMGA